MKRWGIMFMLGWRMVASEHETRLIFHPPPHLREASVVLRLATPAEWAPLHAAPQEVLGARHVIRVEGEKRISFFFEETGEQYLLDCRAAAPILLDVAIACRDIMTHLSLPLPTRAQEVQQKIFEGGERCVSADMHQPHDESNRWRAWRLEQNGRDDLARLWYETAYTQETDPSVAAKLSLLALKKGDRRSAKKWLKRTDPHSRLGVFVQLEWLAAENKSFDVIALYERFEQEWCGAVSIRAAHLAGRAAFMIGDDGRGEMLFRQVLEQDPAYLPVYREWLNVTAEHVEERRTTIAELMTWLRRATPSAATRELEGLLKAALKQSS